MDIVSAVTTATAMSTVLAMAITVARQWRRMNTKRDSSYKQFRTGLVSGLRNGIVVELKVAEYLLLGCLERSERQSFADRLGDWLRRIFLEITSELENVVIDGDSDSVVDWGKRLHAIIGELDSKSPFAGLPDAEKNLLSDVGHFVPVGAAERAQDNGSGRCDPGPDR